MEQPFKNIKEEIEKKVAEDSTGHGINHLVRVYRLGERLSEQVGADKEVVGGASLTHDLHRIKRVDRFIKPKETLGEVREILEKTSFPKEKINDVLYCVEVHEQFSFEKDYEPPKTLEAKVVQDADNLDAIGAIGVARAFRYGGAHGTPMWRDSDEVSYEEFYNKNEINKTTVDHFYNKLLRLKDSMNTEPAKKIAEERTEYMEEFVQRFRAEWKGIK